MVPRVLTLLLVPGLHEDHLFVFVPGGVGRVGPSDSATRDPTARGWLHAATASSTAILHARGPTLVCLGQFSEAHNMGPRSSPLLVSASQFRRSGPRTHFSQRTNSHPLPTADPPRALFSSPFFFFSKIIFPPPLSLQPSPHPATLHCYTDVTIIKHETTRPPFRLLLLLRLLTLVI